MSIRAKLLTIGAVVLPIMALAHAGVQNPAVMVRMESMKAMGEETKVLGQMAKGEVAFDRARAEQAAARIAQESARTLALFETREDDPKSEALPAIWERWGDFSDKSRTMEMTATTLAEEIPDLAALRTGLGQIGAACKACHEAYRE